MSNQTQEIKMETDTLVNHIKNSIEFAEQGKSRLPNKAWDVPGFTSPKIRNFLNNIGNFPGLHYLEVGVHKGGTFIASNIMNNFISSIAVDNWSEFAVDDSVKAEFFKHCQNLLKPGYKIYEQDCFSITKEQIPFPINCYLYDGSHSCEDQKKALTHFYPMLADKFIFMVDDWNWPDPQNGTRQAILELKLNILFERELNEGWWNGFYVSLLEKNDTNKT